MNTPSTKQRWLQPVWMLAAFSLAAGTVACSDPGGEGEYRSLLEGTKYETRILAQNGVVLEAADSCEDAEQKFRDMLITTMLMSLDQQKRYFQEYRNDSGAVLASAEGAGGSTGNAAPGGDTSAAAGPDEYTETNNQVEGVDEHDLVKTDGTHIYVLSGRDLVVAKSWPVAEAGVLGRVDIKGQPFGLHRQDQQLVVLSNSNVDQLSASKPEPVEGEDYWYGYWWRPVVIATVIDASDPTSPEVVAEHVMDGYILNTRRIDDKVYLVSNSWWGQIEGVDYWPDLEWDKTYSDAHIDAVFDQLAAKNIAAIEATDISEQLPHRYHLDAEGKIDEAKTTSISACTNIFGTSAYAGQGLVTVATLDIDDATLEGSTVMGNWGTVYASHHSLYVASTNWDWSWWWGEDDDKPEITTDVHKFALGKDGVANYAASGRVDGYVLNQFALDELDGRLRIATTTPDWWWWGPDDVDESTNQLFVLEETAKGLETVGFVGGLGKGETIHSVRFVGERGYIVTFRQIDPLYVLDLSEPTAPAVTGELKITGFSSYMHPIDEDHLLTIGREATDEGQVQGLSLQIFDVSDSADPRLVQKRVLGDDWGTWSEAQWDHHAFTYYGSKKLLAIPLQSWEMNDSLGWEGYLTRLELFSIDPAKGIEPAGSISHSAMLAEVEDAHCGERNHYYWNYGWEAQVRRSIFMDDYVWSISNLGMQAHHLGQLSQGPQASLLTRDLGELCEDPYGYYYW